MENTNKGETLQTTDAVGVTETVQLKYINEDPERIRECARILSNIPVKYFGDLMSPSSIQSYLFDYADVVERIQKERDEVAN